MNYSVVTDPMCMFIRFTTLRNENIKNVEPLNVKPDGAYSNVWALKA